MPEAFIFWTLGGPAMLIGGGFAFANGNFGWGILLVLIGALLTWARFIYKEPAHKYTLENCPNKGKQPVYGMSKPGFHWYNFSVGEDDNTMVQCNDCGYSTTAHHINPLGQVSSKLLKIKPRTDLLPTHP